MPFHQPDPSNAPVLSTLQQFEIFKGRGGKIEEFALQTAETPNKVFAIQASLVHEGATTAFLSAMFRFDRDAQAAQLIISKIDRTQEILTGKKKPASISEPGENLGINYIGNH